MPSCPAHNDSKCIVKWVQGTGYTNPYSKLKSCFGGEDKLMAASWASCNLKANSKDSDKNTIHAAILHAAGFTPEGNALTDSLNMIIVKNWALSLQHVQAQTYIQCQAYMHDDVYPRGGC